MSLLINLILLIFLLIMAIGVLRIRNLFAMIILFSLYSLLVSGLFMVLDAPDVSFTEAAVGTGISTVLMFTTLACVHTDHEAKTQSRAKAIPLLISILMGSALFYGTHDIPDFGAQQTQVHQQVGKYYIDQGMEETGVPNIVTAVLASYRSFDTLGEVTVVLTAGLGILMLLGRHKKPHIKGHPRAR
jgi:multicomponent Na+:H+ antiporter subunit B